MKGPAKYVLTAGVILLVIVIAGVFRTMRLPNEQAGLGFVGGPTVSPGGMYSFGITNRSDATITYIAFPAEVRSNGVWTPLKPPPNGGMPRLGAGQTGTIAVTQPEVGEAWRVPVVWGYLPGRWETFKVKATWFVTGHGGFHIQTYTNYTEEVGRQ